MAPRPGTRDGAPGHPRLERPAPHRGKGLVQHRHGRHAFDGRGKERGGPRNGARAPHGRVRVPDGRHLGHPGPRRDPGRGISGTALRHRGSVTRGGQPDLPVRRARRIQAVREVRMWSVSILPALNASLNAASGLLLIAGYLLIRRRLVTPHKLCMGAAFVTSMVFFISYLTLRYYAGMTPFIGQGWIRLVYFTILISPTHLAATIVPLALKIGRAN